MILLLDNYDSFTYNVVQYLGELGARLKVVRNDADTVDALLEEKPEGIVLSPGPGRPERAGIMNLLIEKAAGRIPILGICLGHQAIGQVFGASITYAPTLMHGKTSSILHYDSLLFGGVPSPFIATRYHSLVIDPATVPAELEVTARTPEGVIMAIQHTSLPIYGVQFHPESILTVHGKDILRNFLASI